MTAEADLDLLQERLAALCRRHLAPDAAALLTSLARPAIRLRHTDRRTRSHLGGVALLDDADAWPGADGRPLALVAVLDLGELAPFATDLPLPSEGVVNLFYDTVEQPWGFEPGDREGWRVVPAGPAARPVPTPPGVAAFVSIGLAPGQTLTIPGDRELALAPLLPPLDDTSPAADAVLDALDALEHDWRQVRGITDRVPDHQVGGWPDLVQRPIWQECGVVSQGLSLGEGADWTRIEEASEAVDEEAWRLLLQLDTDQSAGWTWGDGGRLYYAVRPQPEAPDPLSDGWLVLQCY